LASGGAWAQGVDPTKALIGTWEGIAPGLQQNKFWTIIIRSVNKKDEGSWGAEGSYGVTGSSLGPMTYQVSLQGGEIVVDFYQAQNPVRPKLVGDRKLDGYINIAAGRRSDNRQIKFEKLESKLEEPK
jgi:hypothetical protein